MGDPAGIGSEVIAKAISVTDVHKEARVVVYGDPWILARAMEMVTAPIKVVEVQSPAEIAASEQEDLCLWVVPVTNLAHSGCTWGQPVPESDKAQMQYIYRAVEAVQAGAADALVTGPVHKVAMRRAGAKFPGHTELLAQLTSSGPPVMMLAGPTLKVVPLTTHVPLVKVAQMLSPSLLLHAISVTNDALVRFFRRSSPRLAVAGLNPHAGEDGLFGTEEQQTITPAIQNAQALGINVVGPLPADSVFLRAVDGEFDVVIGMYHDQALIPVKLVDFDEAVNVTLGLPLIRTSVDHGTAYDIAGQGVASARSMIAALRMASHMVRDTQRDSR